MGIVPLQLIDTHVHLDLTEFENDRETVIARARESGVTRMITVGVTLETSQAATSLADTHPSIYAAVGVHPHAARHWDESARDTLRDLAAHPKVVAIGEIGLDYYRDRSPRADQRRAFRAQLDLASELGKPVIVHDREAHDDLLQILTAWAVERRYPGQRGVVHCFSGDGNMAQELLGLGFYLGFDGPVTYKNAKQLRALVEQIPADRILVETDSPFLTPHPHRGQRNEPAHVRLVAEAIAEIHQMDLPAFAGQTTQNARNLFAMPTATSSAEENPPGRKG
ncbi:MAG: TatD family hydrolase [Chloroflexi bacterium]|nr:TatD family hydrolase [Chloroflexota bacterium]